MTAAIQSSSASIGILQALSATGAITLRSAVPIIMGQNIGTCVTALLSAVGANKNARRTAMVHLYFNIIGTLLFLVLYSAADALISFSFMDGPADQISIAVVHTAFNLFATAVMLPFGKGLERLANLTIPRQENETEQFLALDERLMEAPSVAIGRCRDITVDMANTARASMLRAMSLLRTYDSEIARQVEEGEQALDRYEDEIGSYLVKLSSRNLSDNDSREVSELLHSIGDFERIGDHATNLLETAQEMNEKHLTFSDEAWEELSHMLRAVQSVLELGVAAFEARDLQAAAGVEPLEDVVDDLKNLLRSRHIDRLKNNICTIEQGFLYSDVLTNCERVADHCSNIAVCLLTSEQESFDPHSYFSETRKQMETYQELYRNYQVQFGL